MGYAPHTNQDPGKPMILGGFREAEYGNFFEFAQLPEHATRYFGDEFCHMVYVYAAIGQGFRYAKVLKTVAYVVVDETPTGGPVVAKWTINGHRAYH